jgi:glycosyltransferase involved in cell wall biosynthesis
LHSGSFIFTSHFLGHEHQSRVPALHNPQLRDGLSVRLSFQVKIAILWTGLSGYLNACLKELASREGVQLFICYQVADANAPFDDAQFAWMRNRFVWRAEKDLEPLESRLREFDPDILVFAGWHLAPYRKAAQQHARRSWRVMTMDNCWLATLKQRLAVLASPLFPRPLADAVWLAGERQAVFAGKLGFEQRNILRGLYSCDQPAIERVHLARIQDGRPLARAFLFIGRFVEEKGIDVLIEAYRRYRETAHDPWPLICCGAGPLQDRLEEQPGIEMRGFVQPEHLPRVLGSAGCFVLPSRFEPWAVVVHEAVTAGLPVLASDRVGSVVHLVQPGFNGFIFDWDDVRGLAGLFGRISTLTQSRLEDMADASHMLSRQFSPVRWADTLLQSHQLSEHRPQGSGQ